MMSCQLNKQILRALSWFIQRSLIVCGNALDEFVRCTMESFRYFPSSPHSISNSPLHRSFRTSKDFNASSIKSQVSTSTFLTLFHSCCFRPRLAGRICSLRSSEFTPSQSFLRWSSNPKPLLLFRFQKRHSSLVISSTMVWLSNDLNQGFPQVSSQDSQSFLEKELPFHSDLVLGELENGLRYVIFPNKTPPNRFEAHLEVHAGSVDERADQQVKIFSNILFWVQKLLVLGFGSSGWTCDLLGESKEGILARNRLKIKCVHWFPSYGVPCALPVNQRSNQEADDVSSLRRIEGCCV